AFHVTGVQTCALPILAVSYAFVRRDLHQGAGARTTLATAYPHRRSTDWVCSEGHSTGGHVTASGSVRNRYEKPGTAYETTTNRREWRTSPLRKGVRRRSR